MQDLRIILIILGAVAIAALLIHGLWTSQKGRQKPLREKPLSKVGNSAQDHTDSKLDEFDSDGIGRVRVASNHQAASLSRDHEIEDDWQISAHFSAMSDDDSDEPNLGLPPTLSSSVFAEDPDDEQRAAPAFAAHQGTPEKNSTASLPSRTHANKAGLSASPIETAAELRARQYRQGEIDPLFDNHQPNNSAPHGPVETPVIDQQAPVKQQNVEQPSAEPTTVKQVDNLAPVATQSQDVTQSQAPLSDAVAETAVTPPPAITKTWQEVYVISLVAKPNLVISGIDLMRAVTEVGFIFGDMDIFHRYQGNSTEGEALFSLANLVNPGTFTPDAMSEFTTPGVSIFMQLPKPGMAKNNFNMMIQAAGNMAEDLDAVLLDGKRETLGLDYLVRCRSQLNDFDSQAQ